MSKDEKSISKSVFLQIFRTTVQKNGNIENIK